MFKGYMPARSITKTIPKRLIASIIKNRSAKVTHASVQVTFSKTSLYIALIFEQLANSKNDLENEVVPNKS
jgi:hypothetical protein